MSELRPRHDAAARARGAVLLEQNAALEGLQLSPASKTDSAEYVAGTITGAEMVTRARIRAGLERDGCQSS